MKDEVAAARRASSFVFYSSFSLHPSSLSLWNAGRRTGCRLRFTFGRQLPLQQRAQGDQPKKTRELRPGLCAVNPDKPLQYGEMAWLLPRGDPALKAWMDQWFHLAKMGGEYDRITGKWLR